MKTFLFCACLFAAVFFSSKAHSQTTAAIVKTDTLKKGKNYILFSKSENIENVRFTKSKKAKENILYIRFGFQTPVPSSNSIQGTVLQSNRKYTEDGSVPVFDKIDIISGKYENIKVQSETKIKNLFTLTGLAFPLHLKITSGKESIDLEVTEPGEWNIDIELKNN